MIAAAFLCLAVTVTDGDTFHCDGQRIRLARIDAPEMRGHCRPGRNCAPGDPVASRDALQRKLSAGRVQCQPVPASTRGGSPIDRYGRTVARCSVNGRDIGEAMVREGFAVRWPR